jgi:hypothetical protein
MKKLKAIVLAIEMTQDDMFPTDAPKTVFYDIVDDLETVTSTVDSLTTEFNSVTMRGWMSMNERREIAQAVKDRGNKLVFKPIVMGG